ncbi:MAG: hypothetical protein OHK0017_01150 [Patescibacteria group bacterium]
MSIQKIEPLLKVLTSSQVDKVEKVNPVELFRQIETEMRNTIKIEHEVLKSSKGLMWELEISTPDPITNFNRISFACGKIISEFRRLSILDLCYIKIQLDKSENTKILEKSFIEMMSTISGDNNWFFSQETPSGGKSLYYCGAKRVADLELLENQETGEVLIENLNKIINDETIKTLRGSIPSIQDLEASGYTVYDSKRFFKGSGFSQGESLIILGRVLRLQGERFKYLLKGSAVKLYNMLNQKDLEGSQDFRLVLDQQNNVIAFVYSNSGYISFLAKNSNNAPKGVGVSILNDLVSQLRTQKKERGIVERVYGRFILPPNITRDSVSLESLKGYGVGAALQIQGCKIVPQGFSPGVAFIVDDKGLLQPTSKVLIEFE